MLSLYQSTGYAMSNSFAIKSNLCLNSVFEYDFVEIVNVMVSKYVVLWNTLLTTF